MNVSLSNINIAISLHKPILAGLDPDQIYNTPKLHNITQMYCILYIKVSSFNSSSLERKKKNGMMEMMTEMTAVLERHSRVEVKWGVSSEALE